MNPRLVLGILILVPAYLMIISSTATAAEAAVVFSKEFTPDTIGPGSVSVLEFTIDNSKSDMPVGGLAFADALPQGMTLASPAFVANSCLGILTAPDGGAVITLSNGEVAAGGSCSVLVNVTAVLDNGGIKTYTNVSGDLTSDAGNSGTASANLEVHDDIPSFTKSFSPATVGFGGRSTLTFTIDNTTECGECADDIDFLQFTDNLPAGMVVASPANASTDCNSTLSEPLTAVPGTSVISLYASGIVPSYVVAGEETCTVNVDVTGNAVGALGNVTDSLLYEVVPSSTELQAGKAAATLEVTGADYPLRITKDFVDDPVVPGGTTILEFTISNGSRTDAATAITFHDNLEGTLAGLTATLPPSPTPPCGAVSTLEPDADGFTLVDGTLPPEGSCTFQVELSVPGSSDPGTYPNTTTPVTGAINGEGVTGNTASDLLFVSPPPALSFTKEFIEDPAAAGNPATIRFTITNNSPYAATNIGFEDLLDDAIPGMAANSLVSGGVPDPQLDVCGNGSELTVFSYTFGSTTIVFPSTLQFFSGGLEPAGQSGDSCTFDVVVDIPPGIAGGIYTNTTTDITGLLGGDVPFTEPPASTDFQIVTAPRLKKEFTDDPVLPGGTATLEFVLTNADLTNPATDIAFTDVLSDALSGLIFDSVVTTNCDGTIAGTSTSTISYSGGSLLPTASCAIEVLLTVPGVAGGTYTNTTSEITATVAGLIATGTTASDDLVVSGLQFSKEFTDDPVIAGAVASLQFTLDNTGGSVDTTEISFTDNLGQNPGPVFLGMSAEGLPINACGGTVSGTTVVSFSGGSVTAGTSCSFTIPVRVPGNTSDSTYWNVTSTLSANFGAGSVFLPEARDKLIVSSEVLSLTKEFTDDPVTPGAEVTLEFTLTNLSATEDISGIAFSDDLDAVLSGLTATGATQNTCGGMAGGFPTGLFEYAGGSLAAGASCTVTLTLQVPTGLVTGDQFLNTTSEVTGDTDPGKLPVTGSPASDTLNIRTLTLSKSFDGPTAATGTAIMTITIENLDTNPVGGLSFSDDLEAVLPGLVATGLPAADVCGAGSEVSGTSFLSFSGGNLPGGGTCSFNVTLAVPAAAVAGSFINTTSGLYQNGLIAADPATASLTVEPPPTFAKAFGPDSIVAGAPSQLVFTIDNAASALAANGLDFTDNLPAGVVVATPSNASTTCTGGTVTAVAGSGTVSYTGGSVGAGASCTVQADTTSVAGGKYVNTSGALTSSSGTSGTASDTLTVTPPPIPGFAKAFAPTRILAGDISILTLTIDNGTSLVAATGLDVTDNLPAGMVVADAPSVQNTCTGGTITTVPGSKVFSYSGGEVSAGSECAVSVVVSAANAGDYLNTTGDLTSSSGNSGTASAKLHVDPQPEFSKEFKPASILLGELSTLILTIDNSLSTVAASNISLRDQLPAGMAIASEPYAKTDCEQGTLSAPPGSRLVSYLGGAVAANSACTVQVDVVGLMAGKHLNTTDDLTSSSGNSGKAQATLAVDALGTICFLGPDKYVIPAGIVFSGAGTTEISAEGGIVSDGELFIDSPHSLILKAPFVDFAPLLQVQDGAPGAQLQVISEPVICNGGAYN